MVLLNLVTISHSVYKISSEVCAYWMVLDDTESLSVSNDLKQVITVHICAEDCLNMTIQNIASYWGQSIHIVITLMLLHQL